MKMKRQETNSATCEISQHAKFSNLEISRLRNCSPNPLQHLQKPKEKNIRRLAILEDLLKREKLKKENKPNNKRHKKITKKKKKISN